VTFQLNLEQLRKQAEDALGVFAPVQGNAVGIPFMRHIDEAAAVAVGDHGEDAMVFGAEQRAADEKLILHLRGQDAAEQARTIPGTLRVNS